MKKAVLVLLGAMVCTGLTGCKLVKNADANLASAPAGETGDDARISALVGKTYNDKLVPLLSEKAIEVSVLKQAVATGLDAAGGKFGHRGAGDGGAWSFALKGNGTVVSSDRQSRAAHLDVDTDNDGKPDLSLQLGPVVKGSALRDIAPFFSFTDFRDQIEFAKLARVLNDHAAAAIKLPEGDLLNRKVIFTGAAALNSASDKISVIPVSLEIAP